MDLTAAQRRVVETGSGRLRVQGAAATGKTTALRARFLALASETSASRLLVVCRDRMAALAFRDAVLVDLRGGFDALPITTVFGVAHDLVNRAGGDHRLLGQGEQWALVERLLAAEEIDVPTLWPTLAPYVGRPAFVDEVAGAVLALRAAGGSTACDVSGERWAELAAFEERYRRALDDMGATDGPGMLLRATELASAPGFDRFDHVIVDDAHDLSVPAARLVAALGAAASSLVVAADPAVAVGDLDAEAAVALAAAAPSAEVLLDVAFCTSPVEASTICPHPSTEGEVIANVLLEAAAAGVEWDDMAVLVRSPSHRGRSIARALQRHGIPVAGPGGRPADEPVVRAIVDMLRWATGDDTALPRLLSSPLAGLDPLAVRQAEREARDEGVELAGHQAVSPLRELRDELIGLAPSASPALLAHRVYLRLLAPQVPQPDDDGAADANGALDAVVALVDGLNRWSERNPSARLDDYLRSLDGPDAEPDPWRTIQSRGSGVVVTSIRGATGRRWHTVVVAGCLEGELPRVSGFVPFFDPDLLSGSPRSVAQRRAETLEAERRLFWLARTRATTRLVATAGPEPKDLVSRFIAGWPQRDATLPPRPHVARPALPPTESTAPMFPDRSLVLSASQLSTFADCPLKYAYTYGLGVRDEGNVWSRRGTLTHDILERFLAPSDPAQHTWERLMEVVDECWTDDVARYRPQREQIRRELVAMLAQWWEAEGESLDPASVRFTERPFDITVGPHRVVGKIDRVDARPDGTIEVIDYKTSRTPISEAEAADDLQLATYYLAATRDDELVAAGPPSRLRLLYLRDMKERTQPIAADHGAVTEARIIAAAEEILREQFEPSVAADCDHCSFKRLCPLQPEGREVGAP